MVSCYSIEPKSIIELRKLARGIRELADLDSCIYFPIVEFMEQLMPALFPNFSYEIVPDDELPLNKHAVTEIVGNYGTVKIKETVYNGACEGNGQHRMTIAHEIAGHFIPICVLGFKLYASSGEDEVPAYCDPEWQAKCIAGELMMPKHLVKDFTTKRLVDECGVSKDAAIYQRRRFLREMEKENIKK